MSDTTGRPDETIQEYVNILDEIEELASRASYWDEHGPEVKGSPLAELLQSIRADVDCDTVTAAQRTPVGKDLNDQVYTIRGRLWALDNIVQATHATADELRSLRHRKGVIEAEYPLILGAAGYDVEGQPHDDAPPPDDEDECECGGECEWPDEGVVRVWFESEPVTTRLAALGFVEGESDGEWRAPITKETQDFVMDEYAEGNVLDTLFETTDAFDSGAAPE